MKRLLCALLAFGLLSPAFLRAEEPPHLEFVRGLRDRGYPDLALDYLQKLAKNPPADIAPILPLEMALIRRDMAGAISNFEERQKQYLEARRELEAFVARNPTHPRVASARLEIAKVADLQATSQLVRFLREEGQGSRSAQAKQARLMLEDAGKQLAAAAKLVEDQIEKVDDNTPEGKKLKASLENDRNQAELNVATNLLDQVRTYIDEDTVAGAKARSEVVARAIEILKKLSARDLKNRTCWVAKAWLGIAQHENGDSPAGRGTLAVVLTDATPASIDGRRVARYFFMRVLDESPADPKINLNTEIIAEGDRWLAQNRAFANTPEAAGIRYLQAKQYLQQALSGKATATQKAQFFTRIKEIAKVVEQGDSEFATRARLLKIQVINEEGGFKVEIPSLKTFDDCYVRAQYEAEVLDKELKKEGASPEEKETARKTRFDNIIKALLRAIDLATNAKPAQNVPAGDLNNARAILAFAYLSRDRLDDAIKAGEALAFTKPRPPEAMKGAIYALQAYMMQLDGDAKDSPEVKEKARKLAEFMKTTWADDTAGDMGRHRLGLLLYKDQKWPEVVKELRGIRPAYPDAIFTQYLLAMSALQVSKEDPKAVEGGMTYHQIALAALTNMPEPAANADPAAVHTFYQGKLALGAQLFVAKKFKEMEQLIEPLAAKAAASNNFESKDVKDKLVADLVGQMLYAKLGAAQTEYVAGKYAQASAILAPVIARVKKDELPELKKDVQLQWNILGLALQSAVQDGKMDDAKGILEVLTKVSAETNIGGDAQEGATKTLIGLVQLLQGQIQELRRKGNAEKLAQTIKSFNVFVDALAEQQRKKGLTPKVIILLAQSYSSVDEHKKSAGMLEEYLKSAKEPAAPAKGQPASMERAEWEYMKVMHVRELRLNKQLDEAKAELEASQKGPDDKTPGWGKRNLEMVKEDNYLIQEGEGNNRFGVAAQRWSGLVTQLKDRASADARLKENYFECYYNLVYCWYKHGTLLEQPAQKEAKIKEAAKMMIDFEVKWPEFGSDTSRARFEELLRKEPALKEQYDAQKNTK